jgi:putative tryptophan/tyrosine transport system substrate-binding protein
MTAVLVEGADMRRRDFIALGGAAVVALPVDTRAQHSPIPVVGFLRITSAADATNLVTAFRQGLNDAGFFEGQNIAIEYRWADGHGDRLPRLAADLIHRQVAVIVGHSSAAMAAKAATTTIPIVGVVGDDPVRTGLVPNLNRPGGNVTGVSFGTIDVSGKRLGLLCELVPQANVLAALLDPNLVEFEQELQAIEAASKTIGRRLVVVRVAKAEDLDAAFTAIAQSGVSALHVGSGPFFTSQRQRLILLSTRHAIPSSYTDREFVSAGGLLSYGPSQLEAYRRAGNYAARIIRGEKAGDLPVELPRKYELVVNLGTAKLLGLTVPNSMQLLADEVIE